MFGTTSQGWRQIALMLLKALLMHVVFTSMKARHVMMPPVWEATIMMENRFQLIHGRQLHIRHLRMERPKERQRQALVLARTSMVGLLSCMTRQAPEWRARSLKVSWNPLVIVDAGMSATSHSQLEDQIVVPRAAALVEIALHQAFRFDLDQILLTICFFVFFFYNFLSSRTTRSSEFFCVDSNLFSFIQDKQVRGD